MKFSVWKGRGSAPNSSRRVSSTRGARAICLTEGELAQASVTRTGASSGFRPVNRNLLARAWAVRRLDDTTVDFDMPFLDQPSNGSP